MDYIAIVQNIFTCAKSIAAWIKFLLRNIVKYSASYNSNVAAGPPKMTFTSKSY